MTRVSSKLTDLMEAILTENGYSRFSFVPRDSRKGTLHVAGWNGAGEPKTRSFTFPLTEGSRETRFMNFRSQFRRWVLGLPDTDFHPEARTQSAPAIPIAQAPKAVEVLPPVERDETVQAPEPSLIEARFLVSPENLSLLIEVARGTATFIDSSTLALKPKRQTLADLVAELISTDPNSLAIWTVAKVQKTIKGYASSSITSAFTVLTESGLLNKVDYGMYQLRR